MGHIQSQTSQKDLLWKRNIILSHIGKLYVEILKMEP